MAALGIRLRAQLRSRWRAWLALSVLAGVLAGGVVAIAAGAERTQGAYRGYLASINGADAYVDPFVSEQGDTIPLDRVAQLPQVVSSERSVQLAVIARSRSGRPIFPLGPNSIGWVLPTDDRPREAIDRLKLLHGRPANPNRPDEVVGDTQALDILGAHVGDTVALRTIRQHTLDNTQLHLAANPLTTNVGPLVRLRVVGVAANARASVDGGQMHLTRAFFHTYGGRRIGAFIEELEVRLRHGQRDLAAFRRGVAGIAGKQPYLFFEPSAGHPKIQHSIDLEARALWLIAGLAALAALVIAGQAVLRLAADESRDDATLRALGASAAHQLGFAGARAGLIALGAGAISVAVAYLASPSMPIAWARELEPNPGFDFDAPTIAIGAVAVVVVVFAFGLAAGVRGLLAGDLRTGVASAEGEARRRIRLVPGSASPTMLAGLRLATTRTARGTLSAATVAVAVSITALVFAASFHHLTGTPRLYGQTWDYEAIGNEPWPKQLLRSFTADRDLTTVALGSDDTVAINGVDTGVRTWNSIKGNLSPTITSGRAPRFANEIALGAKTLDAVHAHVGGTVRVSSGDRSRVMHVIGRIVLPSSKTNKLGYGGVLTFDALKRVDRSAQPGLLLFRLADGRAAARARKRLDFYFDGNIVIKPDEVGDFGRIDKMPLYIALLAVAAAAAALAHALVVRVRRSRRELAVLKTIGFTRPQVAAALAWQATAIVAAALLIGVPLGIAIGRFAWGLFADDLGVATEVAVPVGSVVLLVPATLVLANAIAAVPGWLAARIRPAPALRTE